MQHHLLISALTAISSAAPDAAGGRQHQGVVYPLPPGTVQVGQVELRPVRCPLTLRREPYTGLASGKPSSPRWT